MGRHIKYQLEITAIYEQSGEHYRNEPLDKFLEWAQNESTYLKVLVQRGANPPVQVRADIKVKSVSQVLDD